MPLTTITAGMSVKNPGPTEYSSVGHTISLAVELDVQDADHARAATKALCCEVRSMLAAEVANGSPTSADAGRVDLWGAGGNGGNGNGRKVAAPASRTTSKPGSRSNGRTAARTAPAATKSREAAPISNKQAKYVFQLARRSGLRTQAEVTGWIHEKLGVDRGVYELTKVEASRAINLLNNGNGGNGK